MPVVSVAFFHGDVGRDLFLCLGDSLQVALLPLNFCDFVLGLKVCASQLVLFSLL